MKCFLTTRLLQLLIVGCCLFVIPAVLLGQTETRRFDQKPVLLAITQYGEQESERILSLWRISLGESSSFVTEGRTVDTPGLIRPLIVVVVEHGRRPSHELIERANGIRQRWINYWEATTGHVRLFPIPDPG